MDYQNTTPVNQPPRGVSWAKIIWPIVTILLFILQPLYLQYFLPQCVFFICGPSLYIISIIDFVWILSGLLIFVPQFESGGIVKFRNGRIILILVISVLLIRFAIPILNTPYGLYKHVTRPQIFITAPVQDSTLEAEKEYELKWDTKYIPSDATLLISYGWSFDDANNLSGVYTVENLGTTINSGTYKFTFDPEKIKSRKYNLEISLSQYKGSGSIQVGIPSDVYSRLPIIVVNSNDKNIIARENKESLKYLLGDLKEKIYEEYVYNKENHFFSTLCKNGVVNENIQNFKPIIANLIKEKTGSNDQISAGIKCLSNEISFGLSITLNSPESDKSSICVSNSSGHSQGSTNIEAEISTGVPTIYQERSYDKPFIECK